MIANTLKTICGKFESFSIFFWKCLRALLPLSKHLLNLENSLSFFKHKYQHQYTSPLSSRQFEDLIKSPPNVILSLRSSSFPWNNSKPCTALTATSARPFVRKAKANRQTINTNLNTNAPLATVWCMPMSCSHLSPARAKRRGTIDQFRLTPTTSFPRLSL